VDCGVLHDMDSGLHIQLKSCTTILLKINEHWASNHNLHHKYWASRSSEVKYNKKIEKTLEGRFQIRALTVNGLHIQVKSSKTKELKKERKMGFNSNEVMYNKKIEKKWTFNFKLEHEHWASHSSEFN
jgi:hypothetical protein